MRDLYAVVCERWNALYHDLGGELAVGACGLGQRFVTIGLEAAVGVFLTYPDDETNDMLLKVTRCLVAGWLPSLSERVRVVGVGFLDLRTKLVFGEHS
jgi:hypothetical protein